MSVLTVGTEMYAGGVACCPLVSHGVLMGHVDRRTDDRSLHYAFRKTRPAL